MSEVLVTPTVVGVSALPLGLLVGGSVLTIALVFKFVHAMETRSRQAFEEALRSMPRLDSSVLSAPSLVDRQARSQLKALAARLERLCVPPVEKVRLSALLRLASAPYVIEKPVVVEQRLAALMSAQSVREAISARRALTQTVRAGHQEAFTGAVARACSNAARQIGFGRIEVSTGRRGELRLVAQNDSGQALVAEIHAGAAGDPSLAAEVVGVRDGSCRQIMDAFERALAGQGVRYAPPRRSPTGGVCQLEAAKELLQDAGKVGGQRRAQRLNAPRRQEVAVR